MIIAEQVSRYGIADIKIITGCLFKIRLAMIIFLQSCVKLVVLTIQKNGNERDNF